MTKISQKDAVFNAVTQVLSEAGVSFDQGNTKVSDLMTRELRGQVNQILFESFRSGVIELDSEKDDKALRSYVSGLQTNWLNKDKRLNGNVSYIAKNPGSRVGGSDPQIKALRALLSTKTDADEIAEIQGYIDERLASLEASKPAKKVEIDFNSLPEELQAKYSV